MTKEQFRAVAIDIIDNEQFVGAMELFNYDDINQMKVAQVDECDDLESTMPFIDFIDEFYEQIKGDMK